MQRFPVTTVLSLQITLAALAMLGMVLWPPASGAMMLVPLSSGSTSSLATLARAGGAMLLGTGPFPGSLVVIGDRSRLARHIPSWNIIIMAAPPSGCGDSRVYGASA